MFFPIDLSSLFKLQQRLSPKGNCTTIAEWSLFLFCQKITTSVRSCLQNFFFLFQPVPVFVGNLAQNSTRLSLSNEPMLLIRSCLYNMPSFLLLFHTNNTLSMTFKHETITLKIFGCVSLFLPKLCMIIHVYKDFWEFKV